MAVAASPDRIELVDEDHRRRVREGAPEQVAHPARAHADELLHELGRTRRVEAHARLACERARQHRLAGPRRPRKQQAGRHARIDAGEPLRRTQELDDLGELLHRLVATRDVGEACLRRHRPHVDAPPDDRAVAGPRRRAGVLSAPAMDRKRRP